MSGAPPARREHLAGKEGLPVAIGWITAAAISFIGLDEFGIGLGLLTLKPAMAALALAWLLVGIDYAIWRRAPIPQNLPALLFAVYTLAVAALFYLGMTDITTFLQSNFSNTATGPLTKLFNLYLLMSFCLVGSAYVTSRQLYAGILGLLFFQTGKFAYCTYLVMHGQFLKVFFLPNGIPRFALVMGGMTPNQMGAMWLVATIVLLFLHVYRRTSKWQWLLIGLAGLGAISTMSRSMMIGLIFLALAYVWLKPSVLKLSTVIIAGTAAVIAFVIYQADRVADASALERLGKWAVSLEDFQRNIFFGSAWGTNPAPHSAWLQLLSETGLIGFFLALLAVTQVFFRKDKPLRHCIDMAVLLFLPYLFFLSVDIPLLQWQSWVLLIAAGVGLREFTTLKRRENSIFAMSRPGGYELRAANGALAADRDRS